jgi:hypothetical protein
MAWVVPQNLLCVPWADPYDTIKDGIRNWHLGDSLDQSLTLQLFALLFVLEIDAKTC